MIYEYLVILGYFALIVGIGFAFKRLANRSTSDYFRGGGKMLWWMVGSTAFMTQFSAWTFTGAAGKAFNDGFTVTMVFLANAIAYFVGYLYFSHRFRQMRVDTPTEGVRRRFGTHNEKFFSWTLIIFSFINAGVSLNALGVFASAVFNSDLYTTIVVTGLAVLLVSVISGAWGVVASDFIQTLVVAIVSVACAIVALIAVGGPSTIVTEFPTSFVMGPEMNYPLLLVCAFFFFVVKQLQSINNMQDSYRFLNAKDSSHARKAALLATVLMGLGSIIWFIPPWAAAILYPDATAEYPQLGAKAADAVYLVMAKNTMPVGTVGLLLAGLFAATMSTMDSALNRNSGIFVRSLYQPYFGKGKQMSDTHLLHVGKVMSMASGIFVIFVALFFSSLKDMSLFELMMSVSTMLQVPLLIPLFFGMLIKRTPSWAPWATVLVGMVVSWMMSNVISADMIAGWFGIEELTRREASEIRIAATIAAHLLVTSSFFIGSSLFYREEKDAIKQETDSFFADVETPIVSEAGHDQVDAEQRHKLGSMVMTMGIGLLAMMLIPNPLWGRMVFLLCALAVFAIGWMLKRKSLQQTDGATVTQS
ncbi:Na+:solute symporter [Photobacterium sp. BZF1]|uniref:sodium:solute symporter family protein n=1 Tax=Photobacterium sp. BZF1 TaxID=1904457 RepID=UPI0016537990|nr:sodium:solute symporter family protein [Photobacterium sp. BZF1]MBC7002746.1 Na+:solute symporter [Photobacterium sp. BZF1]